MGEETEKVESTFSIAVPENKETDLAYTINDPIIGEPFKVYVSKGGRIPWWVDSVKVQKLIAAFQNQATVTQALISAGISHQQYETFCAAHPEFYYIKDRCKEVFGLQAKLSFGNKLKKDGWLGWAYMKATEPDKYAPDVSRRTTLPEGGSVMTITESAFKDAEGNVVMRRQTAELIEHDGIK